MRVKIRAFGIAKEIVGGPVSQLDLKDKATISEVKDVLSLKYPDFSTLKKFSIAVNESYQDDDYVVTEGDELVIIPPVSGG